MDIEQLYGTWLSYQKEKEDEIRKNEDGEWQRIEFKPNGKMNYMVSLDHKIIQNNHERFWEISEQSDSEIIVNDKKAYNFINLTKDYLVLKIINSDILYHYKKH